MTANYASTDDSADDRFEGINRFVLNSATRLPLVALLLVGCLYFAYSYVRINVPAKHYAVLLRNTGTDIENRHEVAIDSMHKGLQLEVLTEGRYFKNPYVWDWSVYPMVEIPKDKMGVRIRLHGNDMPYGQFVASQQQEKGIVKEVLKPGRYAINALVIDGKSKEPIDGARPQQDYIEVIELWEPETIPAGYKGVVTNLAGELPADPNVLLVETGHRGPQLETLEPGTYYLNPYMLRVNAIDCRSQRFNLSGLGNEMGFPSKDGFWISLDGIIEFRVKPSQAAEVYVTYNDVSNDQPGASAIADEIISKVIMPNARSFCRLRGSNASGRDFIGGETRTAFQADFQAAIRRTCEKQGIEIVQALITRIKPPAAIASPVREREIALQQLSQYQQQELQQEQEAQLAIETALIAQGQKLVDADREVVVLTTSAKQRQGVALAEAQRDREVAEQRQLAAQDQADAILATKHAEASVVNFANQADAAGWKKAVQALDNDGDTYARFVLYQKLAPSFKSIMTNTANSPLMDVFSNLTDDGASLSNVKRTAKP